MPEAIAFAERVRTSTAGTRIPGVDRPMAVSIGVTEAEPGEDIVGLLASADKALRYAKAHERNPVVVATNRSLPPGQQPA